MRIVTEQSNPWNDSKEHFSIPLFRYGDDFFVYEETEENTGQELPQRLDGATAGSVRFLVKDERGASVLAARLFEISRELTNWVEAMDEKHKLERSEDGSQTV